MPKRQLACIMELVKWGRRAGIGSFPFAMRTVRRWESGGLVDNVCKKAEDACKTPTCKVYFS